MIAEVLSSCGRYYLSVCGVTVAMEGDPCRHLLPDEVAQPIPPEELKSATIGGVPVKDMEPSVVRFFRGESWTLQSLEWAARTINTRRGGGHAMKLTKLLELISTLGIILDRVRIVSTLEPMVMLFPDEFRRVFTGQTAKQRGRTLAVAIDGVEFVTLTELDDFEYRKVTL